MIVLPKEKVPASEVNPKFLIIYGLPKCGKTSVLAALPKCLIIDLENGTDYYDAYSIKAKNLEDLAEIRKLLIDNPGQFDYVAIDTGTALEDLVMPLAIALYQSLPSGKNYKGTDITELANGNGYRFTREAFKQVIAGFKGTCKYFILTGHLKDKYLTKEGNEFISMELDLTGKLKSIISADADAIGYLYRSGKKGNETRISFKANENVICGARCNHLSNQDILLAESDADGKMTYHWDKIYLTQ